MSQIHEREKGYSVPLSKVIIFFFFKPESLSHGVAHRLVIVLGDYPVLDPAPVEQCMYAESQTLRTRIN